MNIILRILKPTLYALLGLLLAFVVYANWEEPPLHARVKPIAMTILSVANMNTPEQATAIREQIDQLGGVTACAANTESKMVSITYHADEIDEQTLRQQVAGQAKAPVTKAQFAEFSGPECPVPQSYIMAFEKVKYALCFR